MADAIAIPELGVIEGYFGRPWTWADRRAVVETLAPHGYRFFHYAPKADARLRKDWRTLHPDSEAEDIMSFSAFCRARDVRFGIGLSPFEAFLDFDGPTQADFRAKIAHLDAMGVDDLAILFDDMRGDIPDLAKRQAAMVDAAGGMTSATRLVMCPSYYSDDPVLDRAFGARPARYLEDLGEMLDPAVQVFWTGEEVCARAISEGHLQRVGAALRRAPFLWDNYPVNDGPRMSQFLHLRAFTGRAAGIAGHIAAHAINPALQPHLTLPPAITLAMSYAQGADYCYAAAFLEAATAVFGAELAARLQADLLTLNDAGLHRLGDDTKARLKERYAAFEHPAAREVLDWLDGKAEFSAEAVQTQ